MGAISTTALASYLVYCPLVGAGNTVLIEYGR